MIHVFDSLVNNLAIIRILLGLGILCGASAIAAGWVHAHWAAFILCSIAAIALSVSFYNKGVYDATTATAIQQAQLQQQVADLATRVTLNNSQIVETTVIKEKIIRAKAQTITKYIDREITKYDSQCSIPPVFIETHNTSAERPCDSC